MESARISGIRKSYGRRSVLNGIDIDLVPGQCTGLLGLNGCGKSTLMQILAGVLKADAGSFVYGGTDLLKSRSVLKNVIGYVPQGTPLIAELTAYDNLLLWYDRKRLQASLEDGPLSILGIEAFLKTPVRKMSGGMKKRLTIGCAIANDPEILLLDEPGTALDVICRSALEAYFREFLDKGGSILIATHDVSELEMCDTSYMLQDGIAGRFVFDGDIGHLAGAMIRGSGQDS